jgi:hypothetical protein
MNKHLHILIFLFLIVLTSCQGEDAVEIYDVTYYDATNQVLKRFAVTHLAEITEPVAPVEEGFTFLFWEKTVSDDQRTIRYEPVYQRDFYRMFFITTGAPSLSPRTYAYDDPIDSIPAIEKEGHDFLGWYLDPQFDRPFNEEFMPAHNLILYAKFEVNTYTLDFAYEGIDAVVLEYDALIGDLPEINPIGYAFNGWYVDEDLTVLFDDERMPALDMTLHPGLDALEYAIMIDPGDGEMEVHASLQYRDPLPPLPELTREGYAFSGWFIGGIPYDSEALMPAQDLYVTARWERTHDFVYAEGDQLYLDGNLYRFASFNVPNLHVLEDPYWHMVEAFEQEDAIRSVKAMGGQVIRTYTLSIVGGIRPLEQDNTLAHIMGPETYHEELFLRLDRALELANRHGIRLIIPFIDEWEWFGGVTQFSALYGKNKQAFYRDEDVKNGFKHLIDYVLNRENVYTGIRYKDDPAILAWELGNELRSATDAWITEMSAYVKSIDQNHLLMSGRDEVTDHDLRSDTIDLINVHYYTNNGTDSFDLRATKDRAKTTGLKPMIIGEYGLVPYDEIASMLDVVERSTIAGSLIWSLRFRSIEGGYYEHEDGFSRSYRYPGFSINDDYDEIKIIELLTEHGHRLQQKEIEPIPIPKAPVLLSVEDFGLTWRGQTFSRTFSIERSEDGGSTWTIIAENVIDCYPSGPFHIDFSAVHGVSYTYRVQAHNESGSSDYSNEMSDIDS